MEKPNFTTGFCYPYDLMEICTKFPAQHAIPCSVLYNNEQKGGLFLLCPSSDLTFFKINPSNNPEPKLRFRMLNIGMKAFAIEIHLVFDDEKIMKIHLNPATIQTQEFLKLCFKTKMISFHYYNKAKNFFASAITGLDDEHIEWFKRNYELSKKISPINDYLSVCTALFFEMKSSQRLYHYYEQERIDCFVRQGSMVTKFDVSSQSVPLDWQKMIWN